MNRKEATILALIIFSTVVAWIVFGIFHAQTTSTVSVVQIKEITPLTPTFDNDIISKLSNREEL
jgi:hypothetical protein